MKLTISKYRSDTLWYKIQKLFGFEPEEGRGIKVKFDHADDINMDITMSYILAECVKRHKLMSNGFPLVRFEDQLLMPEHLRVRQTPTDVDEDIALKQWNWVLDEIIWAFEYHVKEDFIFLDKGAHERFTNAMKLFIRYYTSMWL